MIKLETNKAYKYGELYRSICNQGINSNMWQGHYSFVNAVYNDPCDILNNVFDAGIKTDPIDFVQLRWRMEETVIVKQEHIDKLEKEIALFLLRK